MALLFHPERTVPPSSRSATHSFDGVALQPGMNILTDSQREIVVNHPDYQRYSTWKAIEEVEPEQTIVPQVNVDIPNLAQYSVENAESIVFQTYDVPTLESWLAVETRKGLSQSINRRITQIKKGES